MVIFRINNGDLTKLALNATAITTTDRINLQTYLGNYGLRTVHIVNLKRNRRGA